MGRELNENQRICKTQPEQGNFILGMHDDEIDVTYIVIVLVIFIVILVVLGVVRPVQ